MAVQVWFGRVWFGQVRRVAGFAAVVLLATTSAAVGGVTPEESLAARFVKATLADEQSSSITSLDFGPDGRLYVAQQDGIIHVYEIVRDGPGAYRVVKGQAIAHVQAIMNHHDDGEEQIEDVTRQVTGLLAAGTAQTPVLYVTSSDPRQGGGPGGKDLGLDTNSGIVSRLTRDPATGKWAKLDLVRGLPRSEENHAPNGMALSADGRTLYVAQGGMTNNGAPSSEFADLPEYALSAAILSIDLAAIGETTHDLPTLDDPTRGAPEGATPGAGSPAVSGNQDVGDPFGGNDGRNQARLVAGGPVQIHAAGFRNAYDLAVGADGRMWTVDNGANAGWGDKPAGDSPKGVCTNRAQEDGPEQLDILHLVSGPGYYGGHPNPTRGNRANRFAGQSPVEVANPVECDHRTGEEAGALATFPASTNGIVEYRSAVLGEAVAGDLLTAGFDNVLYRVDVRPDGKVGRTAALFDDVATLPLDVTAQGDGEPFPGTVWVGDYGTGEIIVLEPKP